MSIFDRAVSRLLVDVVRADLIRVDDAGDGCRESSHHDPPDVLMGITEFLPLSSLVLAAACAGIAAWRPFMAVATAFWLRSLTDTPDVPVLLPALAVLCSVDLLQPILIGSRMLSRARLLLGPMAAVLAVGLLAPRYDWWIVAPLSMGLGLLSQRFHVRARNAVRAMLGARAAGRRWEAVRSLVSMVLAVMTTVFPLVTILAMGALAVKGRIAEEGIDTGDLDA
ncbi:MAG: hypothetical protein ACKOBV_10005 [Candidatus Kapaibacterium sp.]